ncbi:hypothetical protein OJ996_24910 [Luteolibacter sp. GHJ8]|uniref:Uncharacterized protein n=1 Tax=Luteolibacter rhizosphaerae TaxID=2989719 RepID=A0ABT3GAI2_9BACT|nr:hypothetical protein [Luteolibacter rhizosphaerae]MCW1916853.1 hypothetical protein [Luteolibacter rhizosphaerae]
MKRILPLLASCLILPCLGAGIPVEDGKVMVPHTMLRPNASQAEEIAVLNSITLTQEQWEDLRKVSPNTPKRVELLPETYDDCTCEMNVGGILMKDGRVSVLHVEQTAELLSWYFSDEGDIEFKVDERGQFYFKGILVRYPVLLESIRKAKVAATGRTDVTWTATVSVPLGKSPTDAVYAGRLREVYGLLAEKGWNEGHLPDCFVPKVATVGE